MSYFLLQLLDYFYLFIYASSFLGRSILIKVSRFRFSFMKKSYFRRPTLRAVSLVSLFLFLAALVLSDMTRTFPIFNTSGNFTVVLDPGHAGYLLRVSVHKRQAGSVYLSTYMKRSV